MPPDDNPLTQSDSTHRVLHSSDMPGALPLLRRFGLHDRQVRPDSAIPGSYWGAPEAGLIVDTLYLRADTPLQSALHEGCHFICMDTSRRARP